MATHSSVLAWRIPGTGEADGLPSVESHRVGHEWGNLAAAATVCSQAPPAFLGGTEVCTHITRYTCSSDCSQKAWHMVLVTEPKPNWAVAESSGVQSCLCIWSQDPIWLVSYWSASLPPQTSLYSLRVHWFSYSPTRISKLPWRHFCLWKGAKLLLLIWTSDVLICHLADIAPKQALHLDWKKKKQYIRLETAKKLKRADSEL